MNVLISFLESVILELQDGPSKFILTVNQKDSTERIGKETTSTAVTHSGCVISYEFWEIALKEGPFPMPLDHMSNKHEKNPSYEFVTFFRVDCIYFSPSVQRQTCLWAQHCLGILVIVFWFFRAGWVTMIDFSSILYSAGCLCTKYELNERVRLIYPTSWKQLLLSVSIQSSIHLLLLKWCGIWRWI